MKQLATTLAAHLRGFKIPRGVVRLVCEAISKFDDVQVATAFNALPALRSQLDTIAENSHFQLSIKQQLAVKASYKCIKFDDSEVTQDMISKDVCAMNEPSPSNVSSHYSWVNIGIETLPVRPNLNKIGEPEDLIYKSYSKALRTHRGEPTKLIDKWARYYHTGISCYASLPEDIRQYHGWQTVFGGKLPDEETNADCDFANGHIGITFEQGMKVRLFASPNLIFQSYLEPLKRALQTMCRDIPEDYHGDQAEGRRAVQQMLRDGTEVACFDLSSATHRFPWELQLRMLKSFQTRQDYVRIADFVSKMEYESRWGSLKWAAGQPLGTGPSFFTFSMCHHLLIRGIFHRLGEDWNGGYALLGDDIAIFNKKVAKCYRKVMRNIGCQINESKSTCSAEVGEFAGAYIDRDNIINIGKFRKIDHTNEFSYLTLWDEAPAHLHDVRQFLKGDAMDEVLNTYVRLTVIDESSKILKTDCYRYPSGQVIHLNTKLVERGVTHQLDPVAYDIRISRYADDVLSIFAKCVECYPDAVTPHLLSRNMIVMTGLIELVQFGLVDNLEGWFNFTPIWWKDFCQISGISPDYYSNFKAVRETNRFLMSLFFVTSQGRNSVINRYNRSVKRACIRYRKLEADKGIIGIYDEIQTLMRRNNVAEVLTLEKAVALPV